jgi:hypothetical protein
MNIELDWVVGPAINIYKEFKNSNRLALLRNAAGMSGVEFKRKAKIFNDSYAIHESLLCVNTSQIFLSLLSLII